MPVRVKTEDTPEPVLSSSPLTTKKGISRPFDDDIDSESSNDGGGDRVVREIDVFLSPELGQQLYLLQYPLQHTEVGQLTAARIKPRHGMIELEQPLPELPKRHYGIGEPNLSYVTNRTFRSHTIPVETHMCLAKLKEEESPDGVGTKRTALHMVPLQHIVQLRPSLHHIDADPSNKDSDNAMDLDDLDKDDQEQKPLMFKRKESERATNARKSSFAYKKSSEDAEEWQPLEICDEESIEHHGAMDLVACPSRHQHVLATPDPSKTRPRYIESLNYMPLARNDPSQGAMNMGVLSSSSNVKAVLTRLTVLLRNGWPIPYSVLRDRFSGPNNSDEEVNEEVLFQALAVCAVMVRGNFCLHSRFVALPPVLQHARTFILLVLQTKGSVQRERLQIVYQGSKTVTTEKLYVLLNQVAKRTVKGWELRVDDDLAFVSMHPEQSELHLQYWEKQNQSRYFRQLLQKYEAV
ncbi:hypothetical protein ACA910_014078 [Epithemia clementina (nom. ined.)]